MQDNRVPWHYGLAEASAAVSAVGAAAYGILYFFLEMKAAGYFALICIGIAVVSYVIQRRGTR